MKPVIGTVNRIDFTNGGLGNQFTTIDGKKYFTWWDFKQGVKEGVRVEYTVQRDVTVCHAPRIVGDVATIRRVIAEVK